VGTHRPRWRVAAAIILVLALAAVAAPTPADRAGHAAALPRGAAAEPPGLPTDEAARAWIDRAEAARAAGEAIAAPKVVPGAPGTPPTGAGPAPNGPDAGPVPPPQDTGSLLVTFGSDVSSTAAEDIVQDAGAEAEPIPGTDTVEVTAAEPELADVAAELTAEPEVEAVEPNRVRSASAVPNDPAYPSQQAYLTQIGAPTAWDVADRGAPKVVAVLDTGVDRDHPDLAPNLVAGFDILNGDSDPSDDNGHGTAVAGVVGAATSNSVGVAGVAWNTKIMPVKVLGADGTGFDGAIAEGITWATDHGADIINLSLGGFGSSTALEQAVDYALASDVVVVAAAGNEGAGVPSYPAAIPGVLAVTATDAQGQFAWFSNHGPWVTLAAPGVGITSTALAAGPNAATAPVTGTSFSSPMVAGIAALLRERHPGWSWDKVAYELVRTARDAGPAGIDDAYGFGIVDGAAALDVGPHGSISAPNLTGDASDLPASPRLITVGTTVTEGLLVELDRDWFAFDVPATSGARITVTPPPFGWLTRGAEMDAVVELHGPGGGLVASADAAGVAATETIEVTVGPGRHTLAVANYFASQGPAAYSVRVDLGPLPAARWRPPEQFTVGVVPLGGQVADVTGDGRDDLVATGASGSGTGTDLSIFAQTASGTLAAQPPVPTGVALPPAAPSTGDFDGDGDTDVAILRSGGTRVFWQQGGRLAAPVSDPVAFDDLRGLGDTDGDGRDEIVAVRDDAMVLLTWTGSAFTATPVGGPVPTVSDTGDIDGDGDDELIDWSGGLAVRHRQQGGSFTSVPVNLGATPTSLEVGDVSGDGRADIVATTTEASPPDRLVVAVQAANGTFGPPVSRASAPNAGPPLIGELSGDPRLDVAVAHPGGGGVGTYVQGASGQLGEEQVMLSPWPDSFGPHGLAAGDLDGDDLDDLVVADFRTLWVLRHVGRRAEPEGPGPWLRTTAPAPHARSVATSARPTITFGRDLLASSVSPDTVLLLDGRTAAAVEATVSRSGRTVTVTPSGPLTPGVPYQVFVAGVQDSTGAFAPPLTIPFVTLPAAPPTYPVGATYSPFSGDIDGNGFDDIFWYGPGTAADALWLFDGDGRVGLPVSVGGTYTPTAADLDGNGYDDILWYQPGPASDGIWYSGPDGITPEPVTVGGTYTPVTGDFDRNGFDDILWYGRGTIADSVWYFNASGITGRSVVVNGLYVPATGDFNRDGFADVLWYAAGSGAEAIWYGQPSGFRGGSAPQVGGTYTVRVLDATGDGYDDVFWYAGTASSLWRGGPSGFTGQAGPAMPSGMRPVTGELTGDGRDDLFAYVPGATADRLRPGTANGIG
jgi:type VII secretion-associated serine protease mycosin